MDKFYLILNSDVFLFRKGNQILFYRMHSPKIILNICIGWESAYSQWEDVNNLYCAELDSKLLENKEFRSDVQLLVTSEMAQLLPVGESSSRPISIPPVLSVQRSKVKFKEREDILQAEDFSRYLQKIVIYLNGEPNIAETRHKQFTYILERANDELKIDTLKCILRQLKGMKIHHLTFSGYNVFEYEYWQQCIAEIDVLNAQKEFYVDCNQLIKNMDVVRKVNSEQFVFTILVDNKHPFVLSLLDRLEGVHVNWLFLITSEDEYTGASDLIENYSLRNAAIKPVYDNNLSFFENHIYLTSEDLLELNPSKKEIFIHQSINVSDFGQLNIIPNGTVYSNLSNKKIGNVNKESLNSMIADEICTGHSWLRIRDQKPCCDCIYQWLCPSPSNYELAIGKPNLCHVKP